MKPTITPETPQPSAAPEELWSSDAIARMLQALDVPWVSLVPGASFRGLHDSLVNHIGNQRPQMILCLHEGVAVSMAHGYAKASGRMMGAILHSNVGLLNGSMGIFNAWCDRVPMLILGATGPWDAAKRRPWIDWIHTASDQGALVRGYTKWDNQPGVGAGGLRRAAARRPDGHHGPVRADLRQPRRRAPGIEARRAAALARSLALRRAGLAAPRARADRARRRRAVRRVRAGHAGRPRQAHRRELARARGARREARRPGDDGPQDRGELPDSPSAARRSARHVPLRGRGRDRAGGRRDPGARLDRSGGHAQAGLRRAARSAPRSSRPRATCTSTVASAWTTSGCRPSTSTCWPSPTSPCRCCSRRAAARACRGARRRTGREPPRLRRPEPARRRRGAQRGDRGRRRVPDAPATRLARARRGTSRIRSTTSAATAARESARARGSRWARVWR